MEAVQLRTQIVTLLNTVDNVDILEMVKNLLSKSKEVYQLNEFETSMLNESAAEFEKGNFYSHEDIHIEVQEWLKSN